ncbi:glycosyltransferase family 2 protein [Oceanicola sp. D3]|uniref:glycosyltransferase family 2 protein n=1 Tax=Oceanicola sp. D3 TaxID=2587163 RepID=UPI0011223CFF|nr:glycosyltransferase family A protein [Oceanicola sp. D3]QDC07938.1 glycosyltransferase family 2 protein [Oceanicola sp. D3]
MSEAASVIIVSRRRPDELRRNLPAFRLQSHRNFELILVADPPGLAVARELNLSDRMKLVEFDEANISAARNLGLAQAAAPLVAFIDDDATPEPPWLARLLAPFDDSDVVASTGFVRGRNGISMQWQGVATDETGADIALDVNEQETTVLPIARCVKTHGTNCAFRRAALARIGGFDPAFRFFLDETDVTHRLVPQGGKTAIVPLAQVHHGFAANASRKANRAPTDLAQIGRSAALFLRRHCPPDRRDAALDALRSGQAERLAHHRAERRLSTEDEAPLMESLERGITEGQMADLSDPQALPEATVAFRPFPQGPGPRRHEVRSCGLWGYRKALAQARADAAAGDKAITLLRLSRTTRFHASRFDPAGFWVQRGGLFGRSLRSDPLVRFWRRADRIKRETARIDAFRSPES